MKYFTPERFERLNSRDPDVMLATYQEWGRIGSQYVAARTKWVGSAPVGIRKLTEQFCGHDLQIVSQSRVGAATFILFAVGEGRAWMLSYRTLSEPMLTETDSADGCWDDGGQRLWLYDELERISGGYYRQEILISDGSVLQIDFSDVQIKSMAIPRSDQRKRKLDLTMEFTVSGDSLLTGFCRGSLTVEKKTAPRPSRKTTKTLSKRSNKARQNGK